MSLRKIDIAKCLSSEVSLNLNDSSEFLDAFLESIKNNCIKKQVKISNFGTFYYKATAQRVGRNPSTGIEYKIPSIKKLYFLVSKKIRKRLN